MPDDASSKTNGSLDTKSIYYLHPSDHTGLNLVPVTLKGENYQEWEQALRNAFSARRKLSFIDGRVSQPADTDPIYDDWCAVNSMMVGWILRTVDSSIRSSLPYKKSAKALWDEIEQRFSIGNAPRVHQLRTEIARFRQNGQSVAVYFGRLKQLQDELQNYRKPRTCSCTGCKCAWVADLHSEREEDYVHEFLMGLDDGPYGALRSQILAQEPLPGLNRVYALAIQEERHRAVSTERAAGNDVVAFAAQHKVSAFKSSSAGRSDSSSKGDKPTCTHCGRLGHDMTSCFKLHGYPDWWEEYRQKRGDSTSSGAGRGKGVPLSSSHRPSAPNRGSPGLANAAQGVASSSGSSAALTSQDRAALSPALTNDQWTTMLDMLKSFKGSSEDRLMGPHYEDGDWSR